MDASIWTYSVGFPDSQSEGRWIPHYPHVDTLLGQLQKAAFQQLGDVAEPRKYYQASLNLTLGYNQKLLKIIKKYH